MCKNVKKYLVIGIFCILLCITGCAQINSIKEVFDKNIEKTEKEADLVGSMEEEAEITYDLPQSVPHILINQVGYEPNDPKMITLYGDNIPKTFDVIDASNNTVAYTGKLEVHCYNEEYSSYIAYGDFSGLSTEGEYYIAAEYLGRSYPFEIRQNIINSFLNQALKNYYLSRCGMTLTSNLAGDRAHNACHTEDALLRKDITISKDVTGGWHQDASASKKVVDTARVVSNLLLAYEIFPDVFDDNSGIPESSNGIPDILDEIKYEMDWLIKMQDENTGAVHSAITEVQGKNKSSVIYLEDTTDSASAAFAFCMAKFSFHYQKYDKEYATKCLQAADRAMKHFLLNNSEGEEYPEWFVAASAELYRASGQTNWRKYVEEELAKSDIKESMDSADYYAYITYINTSQPVDMQICKTIMKEIMNRAEGISSDARSSAFGVPFDMEQTNNTKLLNDMIEMSLVDYIIANHEYDTLIEEYMHYLLGKNPKSIVYIDDAGSYNYMKVKDSLGIMKKFDDNSKLVFMLSKISSMNIR